MNFVKMHGNGNDFIVIEDLNNKLKGKESSLAKKVCHRRYGIGADGVLLVRRQNETIEMVIINSDGSYAAMCGNGIRCFAKYVYDNSLVKDKEFDVITGAGIKKISLTVDEDNKAFEIKVNMGFPEFKPELIPCTVKGENVIGKVIKANNKEYKINSLLMNIPHTVIFEEDETLISEGNEIEHHEIFPERTNVNFCKVLNENTIRVRTWERGAGATLACGTGNCASAVIANKLGFVGNKVNIIVPGGKLKVYIENDGVYMIGNAEYICKGVYKF